MSVLSASSEKVNRTGVYPSTSELWQDLREVTRKNRPDWELSTPGLRESWEGDKKLHYPYKEK